MKIYIARVGQGFIMLSFEFGFSEIRCCCSACSVFIDGDFSLSVFGFGCVFVAECAQRLVS